MGVLMTRGWAWAIGAWLVAGVASAAASDKIHHERCPGDPEMQDEDIAAITIAGPLIFVACAGC